MFGWIIVKRKKIRVSKTYGGVKKKKTNETPSQRRRYLGSQKVICVFAKKKKNKPGLERKEQEWIDRLKDAQNTQEQAYEKLETALSKMPASPNRSKK